MNNYISIPDMLLAMDRIEEVARIKFGSHDFKFSFDEELRRINVYWEEYWPMGGHEYMDGEISFTDLNATDKEIVEKLKLEKEKAELERRMYLEKIAQQAEERERLQYLELKAKYEKE